MYVHFKKFEQHDNNLSQKPVAYSNGLVLTQTNVRDEEPSKRNAQLKFLVKYIRLIQFK